MATIRSFEELEMWKRSRQLARLVYEETILGTFAKDWGLRDQINRSAGSVMDNIAEGFERGSKNEFVNFLSYAKGSTGETKSQLYRALDREHFDQTKFEHLANVH